MKRESTAPEFNAEAVVARVLAGEKEMFTQVVERYQNQVYGMLMRMVGDANLSRELSQETFLRAYKHLHTFKRHSSLSTWVTQIALNRASSYFSSNRYKQIKRTVSIEDEPLCDVSTAGDGNTSYDLGEKKNLRQAIAALDPKFRDVVVLYCFEEKSYKEISEILDLPLGTVGSRLNRAIHVLRMELRSNV